MTTRGIPYPRSRLDSLTLANSLDAILHDELDTKEGYAKKLGYSMRKLNSFATGKKVPEFTDILHMAKILDYPPEVWVKLWVNDRLRDAGAGFKIAPGQVFQASAKKKKKKKAQPKRREGAKTRQGARTHKA